MTPASVLAKIDSLFAERGGGEYHGEAVTQLEHALQSAHMAELDGRPAEWIAAALLGLYFALFYSVVMRKEERELRFHHGTAFDAYAKAVPLFFPRVTAAKVGLGVERVFSFAQYQKNREYRAAIGFLLLLVLLVVEWRLRLIH